MSNKIETYVLYPITSAQKAELDKKLGNFNVKYFTTKQGVLMAQLLFSQYLKTFSKIINNKNN